LGTRELFEDVFTPQDIEISTPGNVFAATCFLQGIPLEQVSPSKLNVDDPDYELIVCARVQKPR
jgi:hypothetical protein